MKTLIFSFILTIFFVSCENSSDLVSPTKSKTENDAIKMQYQINTNLAHAQSYYIFADYGNGYLYQCVAESIYRGDDDTAPNLQWTFSKSEMTSDVAKFRIIAHWDNQPHRDIQLGVIYFFNLHE